MQIRLTVNGKPVRADVTPRTSLADFLREALNLTATHLGCEHGICGACTVTLNGQPVRACLTLAVACDGYEVRTLEGLLTDEIMLALRAYARANKDELKAGRAKIDGVTFVLTTKGSFR